MQNVAPTLALARRARQLLQLAFLAMSAGIFVIVVALTMFVIRAASETGETYSFYNFLRTALLFFGVLLMIAGAAMVLRAITWKTDNNLAIVTGAHLAQYLDESYTFIRNVSKFRLGYIDAVLVGPPGVLVFRTLNAEGQYLNEGGKWLVRDRRGDWTPAAINPTKDTIVDIQALRTYLDRYDLDEVPVYGVVVFTTKPTKISLQLVNPQVPVAQLEQLYDALQEQYLVNEARITPQQITAVVRKLYTPH